MKHGDILTGRDRPHSSMWSRMVPYGAWGLDESNPLYGSRGSITPYGPHAPYGTILDHIDE